MTRETMVSVQQPEESPDDQQEVIEVQILPQVSFRVTIGEEIGLALILRLRATTYKLL